MDALAQSPPGGFAPGQENNRQSPMSERTRLWLVILLSLSFVGAFGVVILFKVLQDRSDTLVTAEYELASVAGALSEQVRSSLSNVESLLDLSQTVILDPPSASGPSPSSERLFEHISRQSYVHEFVVVDTKGSVVFDSIERNTPAEAYASQDFFLFHQNQAGPDLFVSYGNSARFSKRLISTDGSFAGVAVASMTPDYLHQIATSANLDKTYQLFLAGRSGEIVASVPRIRESIRSQVAERLGAPWPVENTSGQVVVYARDEQLQRMLIAARKLRSTPFTFYLAKPINAVLAPWHNSLRFYFLIIFGPALFGAGLCSVLVRQYEQKRLLEFANISSETRLQLAIDSASGGIWEWDLENDQLHWSPSMYAILGRTDGSPVLTREDARALIKEEDRDRLDKLGNLSNYTSQGYETIFRVRHSHGHWVWVHMRGKAQADPADISGNSKTRIIGMAMDISLQKNAELRIAEVQRLLRDAINSISESFVLWDKNRRLVLCNENFAKFYKIEQEYLKSGTGYDVVMEHCQSPGKIIYREEEGDELRPNPETGTAELQFAGTRWIHVTTHQTADGGWVSVGTDVTPLKDQERELATSEHKLRKYIEELEVSREELGRESDKRAELAVKYANQKALAETANRAKTEFLANMSHELRTPLNAIMGFAQIMHDSLYGPLGDKRYDEYVSDIISSSKHLLEIISDILDMSEIETGRMVLDKQPLDLRETISDVVRLVEPHLFDGGLHLEQDLRAIPPVNGDVRSLKQVLLNLLSNAIRFTDNGGVVTIRTYMEQNHVVMTVEDTGIGIAQKDLARLGRPFEQIDNRDTKHTHGVGLGLAIAKSLVEMHGGTLSIQSRLGIGTIVIVVLPAHQSLMKGPETLFNDPLPEEDARPHRSRRPDFPQEPREGMQQFLSKGGRSQ